MILILMLNMVEIESLQPLLMKYMKKYKNGETVYLECYCGDGIKKNCHGEVIVEKLQKDFFVKE